jgi:molecular chaperone HtpG
VSSAIPPEFRDLLADSQFEPAVLQFVDACEQILGANEMPFFPAYTDHGIDHVRAVLDAAVKLVPEQVWTGKLLEAADAAVLVSATYLHDLAMHLREPGFRTLISGSPSPFKPLPWFDADQRGHSADQPWAILWQDFRKEARRFSKSQLDRLLGPASSETPAIAYGDLDRKPEEWTKGDRLLVGEFLRRHHARLSHEIAIYGFPAIPDGEFPVLSRTLPHLADAIGTAARSHNMDLRVAHDYLADREPGNLRPDGAALLYLMGVLRVADYFQLEGNRAAPLLLHLEDPQSPQSIEEWQKHQAISSISWKHDDPLAVYLQVSPSHNL